MKLTAAQLRYLSRCAADAARLAGEEIAASRPAVVGRKAGGHSDASQVVTEVDLRAEEVIFEALAPTLDRFDLCVLTEERPDDSRRHQRSFFWCIDPLDGTLPFIEGKVGYAVSIALVDKSGVPELGAVFAPATGASYCAVRGQGLTRSGQVSTSQQRDSERLSVFLDRSARDRADYVQLVESLDSLARDLGLREAVVEHEAGAVVNACLTLECAPACYFKLPTPGGGGSLWDFAATACLFREAGAIATDFHGRPLDLNRADSTSMSHRGVLFASDAGLAERVRAVCADPAGAIETRGR